MKISIAGSGYVGLVTGACLAEKGHEVVCVDLDPSKVERINRGEAPILEAGLDGLLRRHAGRGIRAVTDLRAAVLASDFTFIAVGTPFDGKTIDLAQVKSAAETIGRALREKEGWHMVVVKSTVVPGTTDDVVGDILERESGKRAGEGFGLGMNPEFLTEGEAIGDFMEPDRLVFGSRDERGFAAFEEVYAGFPGVKRVFTTNRTAEMIKYASNALLATLISFSNEMANLCSTLGGIDAMDVVKGLKLSRYLAGPNGAPAHIAEFLVPGCGFGGSCLPKDIAALIAHGRAHGARLTMLEAARAVNAEQPHRIAALLEDTFSGLKDLPVAVLGLAFRPGTADTRESPAFPVIADLLARGAQVCAYDPAVTAAAEEASEGHYRAGRTTPAFDGRGSLPFDGAVRLCPTLEEAVRGARAVVVVTRWKEFRRLSELLAELPDPPVVVDGRRMLDKSSVPRYQGIGL
jgi:UDPglucose 6-dehydrogenase